jgi:hypothetical protein
MCNVLEHLERREIVLKKIHSILGENGKIYGIVPFLVGVHPDPHDYLRFTEEGLRQLLADAGFSSITVTAVGGGPFIASYYQSEFILPRFLKLAVLPFALLLDKAILWIRPALRAKFPLSYSFQAER